MKYLVENKEGEKPIMFVADKFYIDPSNNITFYDHIGNPLAAVHSMHWVQVKADEDGI